MSFKIEMPKGPLLKSDAVSNPPIFDIPPVQFSPTGGRFDPQENYKKLYNLVRLPEADLQKFVKSLENF